MLEANGLQFLLFLSSDVRHDALTLIKMIPVCGLTQKTKGAGVLMHVIYHRCVVLLIGIPFVGYKETSQPYFPCLVLIQSISKRRLYWTWVHSFVSRIAKNYITVFNNWRICSLDINGTNYILPDTFSILKLFESQIDSTTISGTRDE